MRRVWHHCGRVRTSELRLWEGLESYMQLHIYSDIRKEGLEETIEEVHKTYNNNLMVEVLRARTALASSLELIWKVHLAFSSGEMYPTL